MKIVHTLNRLKEARRYACMERMSVHEICCQPSRPPLFEDGRAVTEGNLDDFIRERTRLYRESWLIPIIDEIIAELESEYNR